MLLYKHLDSSYPCLYIATCTYMKDFEIVTLCSLIVPNWSFDDATLSDIEGQSVKVCASLSDIPSNGLECDIVLKLKATSETGT